MADTITCPHCNGTAVNYVIVTEDGKPTLKPVKCAVCDGKGYIPAPPPPEPETPPAAAPELWPILLPLVIFFTFFVFLWL